jgi:hypothetical protein
MADARSRDPCRHRNVLLEMSDTSPPDARTTGDHVGLEVMLEGHGRERRTGNGVGRMAAGND